MSHTKLETSDYPLAENRPELVRGGRGKTLEDLNLAALQNGDVIMEDLRITPQALEMQASIARAGGREKLADNFSRASELAEIPQEYLMQIYELLRPGRASGKDALMQVAQDLRASYGAHRMAAFIEEAAQEYQRRGLFKARF